MGIEEKVGDVSLPESAADKEKKNPQVSIGMPVYNGEPFIREALDSLLAQTFTDFELIISDNASTDGTEAICREYAAKDDRIRYVRQPENRGALANFQFVLDEAAGEYFMWAAADDWWSENWLSENVAKIEREGLLLSFGKSVRTKADLSIDGPIKRYDFKSDNVSLRLVQYFMTDENTKGNLFYGLINAKFIKNMGVYVPKCKYGIEYPHIYKILAAGKIGCAENALLKKRNPVTGVRRYKYTTLQLILKYLISFKHVINKDRISYYFEFISLSPSVTTKLLIAASIPAKVLISLYFEYVRGAQLGIEILRKELAQKIGNKGMH